MKADLIMIRSVDLNLFPVHDPLLSVVEQCNAGNVDTVIVDGIVRKRDGRLLFDDAKRRVLGEHLIESVARLSAAAGYVLPTAQGAR
jgi:cytosine/adenosine deaminase-related metal-dependent hydrolase